MKISRYRFTIFLLALIFVSTFAVAKNKLNPSTESSLQRSTYKSDIIKISVTAYHRNSDIKPGMKIEAKKKARTNRNKNPFTVTTPSESLAGDYQLVALGGSSGRKTDKLSEPVNRDLMENQNFSLIGSVGDSDSRAEMWIRKDSGSSEHDRIVIDATAKDIPYSVTILNGKSKALRNLDYAKFETQSKDGHQPSQSNRYNKKPKGKGFSFLVHFFDDSLQISKMEGAEILGSIGGKVIEPSKKKGSKPKIRENIGDGDGFSLVYFKPGVKLSDESINEGDMRKGSDYSYVWFSSNQ